MKQALILILSVALAMEAVPLPLRKITGPDRVPSRIPWSSQVIVEPTYSGSLPLREVGARIKASAGAILLLALLGGGSVSHASHGVFAWNHQAVIAASLLFLKKPFSEINVYLVIPKIVFERGHQAAKKWLFRQSALKKILPERPARIVFHSGMMPSGQFISSDPAQNSMSVHGTADVIYVRDERSFQMHSEYYSNVRVKKLPKNPQLFLRELKLRSALRGAVIQLLTEVESPVLPKNPATHTLGLIRIFMTALLDSGYSRKRARSYLKRFDREVLELMRKLHEPMVYTFPAADDWLAWPTLFYEGDVGLFQARVAALSRYSVRGASLHLGTIGQHLRRHYSEKFDNVDLQNFKSLMPSAAGEFRKSRERTLRDLLLNTLHLPSNAFETLLQMNVFSRRTKKMIRKAARYALSQKKGISKSFVTSKGETFGNEDVVTVTQYNARYRRRLSFIESFANTKAADRYRKIMKIDHLPFEELFAARRWLGLVKKSA